MVARNCVLLSVIVGLEVYRVGDNSGRPEVGQVVLPATPGGSPAAGEWQVNVPLTRNNDLPYGTGGLSASARAVKPPMATY